MLKNKDKKNLTEIKATIKLIEENFDNKKLLKYFIGKLKILTDKIVQSYMND